MGGEKEGLVGGNQKSEIKREGFWGKRKALWGGLVISNCWRTLLRESYIIKVGALRMPARHKSIIWCSAFVGETKLNELTLRFRSFYHITGASA